MLTERDKIYLKLVESLEKIPGSEQVIVVTRDDRAVASTVKGINDLMAFMLREKISPEGCNLYIGAYVSKADTEIYRSWDIKHLVIRSSLNNGRAIKVKP